MYAKWAFVAQTCFIESRRMFLKHNLNAGGHNYVSQTCSHISLHIYVSILFNPSGYTNFLKHVSIEVGICFSTMFCLSYTKHMFLKRVSIQMGIYFSIMFQFKWAYISQSCFNSRGHIFLNHVSIQVGIY